MERGEDRKSCMSHIWSSSGIYVKHIHSYSDPLPYPIRLLLDLPNNHFWQHLSRLVTVPNIIKRLRGILASDLHNYVLPTTAELSKSVVKGKSEQVQAYGWSLRNSVQSYTLP